MATYSPIITVSIAINASPLSQEGFGTPMFISPSRTDAAFVQEFTNLTDVSEEFGADSIEERAAVAYFSQTPQPPSIKFGRREAQFEGSPSSPNNGDFYSITVNAGGFSKVFTYSATVPSDTEENVVDSLVTDILADPDIGTGASPQLVTASNSSSGVNSQLVIVGVADVITGVIPFFTVDTTATTLPVDWTEAFVGIDTAAQTMAVITSVDNDFYFVSSNDHTKTWVTEMATNVQGRTKMYFVSSREAEALLPNTDLGPDDVTTSIAEALQDATFPVTRTVYLYHQDDVNFPECAYVASNAVFDAGTVTWANLQGVASASRDPATSKLLSTTQKTNLLNKNANFIEREAGEDFTRIGITSGEEFIDVIRGVDWLESEITLEIRGLLLNQKGGKVTYDDQGIARVRNVIQTALQRAVNRQFLTSFTLTVPLIGAVSTADKLNRVLNDVTFVGVLAGAIHTVNVVGEVIV